MSTLATQFDYKLMSGETEQTIYYQDYAPYKILLIKLSHEVLLNFNRLVVKHFPIIDV